MLTSQLVDEAPPWPGAAAGTSRVARSDGCAGRRAGRARAQRREPRRAAVVRASAAPEGNYLFSVNNPGRVIFEDNNPGRMIARDNTLVECNHEIEVAGPVVEPSTYYDHTLDRSAAVRRS